jgi:PAS domain S-box-containing protein
MINLIEDRSTTRTYTLMIVDIDPATRQLVGDSLRLDGYAVVEAANGKEAIDVCKHGQPDLVLLDGAVPGVDGIELCRKLRRLPGGDSLLILISSSHDDDASLAAALEAGADDILVKPIRPLILRQRVRQALSLRQQQRAYAERMRVISDLSRDYAYEVEIGPDGAARLGWITENLCRMTGYTREEITAEGWSLLIHPDDVMQALVRHDTLLLGEPHNAELRYVTSDGDVLWVHDRAFPVYDEDEGRVVRVHGIGRDITESRAAQQELYESRDRLQLALDAAEDGLWDWNMVDNTTYFSARWLQMLGYAPDELDSSFETWRDLMHPDDRDHVLDALNQHIETGAPYEVEHRLRLRDGGWRWIQAIGKVVERDASGKPTRMTGVHKDIDRRKRAEETVRASEERLRTLIEHASDILYSLTPDGEILYASPNWPELLGHETADVTGRSLLDFIAPEDAAAVRDFLTHIRADGRQNGLECRVRHADGAWRWFSFSGSRATDPAGRDYLVGTGHDITEQHRAKQALAVSEERYRIISTTVSDYAYSYLVSEQGELSLEWSSQAFADITGYSWEEMDPSGLQALIYPEDANVVLMRIARLLTGEVDVSEFRIVTRSGEVRWLLDHGYPVHDEASGRVTRIYGAAKDITQRKLDEGKLEEQAEALRARNEELDAFAYTVAHDLKNPIASMMGFASLMQNYYDRMEPDKIEEYLGLIMEGGYKLKEIINALLMLSGVSKMENAEMTPLDMPEIVDSACRRLNAIIDECAAEIIHPDAWPDAIGYGPWVEEVWTNYISNAVKYGGQPPRVELGADEVDGGMVRFWVRDNGRGLTGEEQGRVFTPFTRLNQVKIEGHGLGLSVVQRIVTRLGGQVCVESALDAGSTFSFTLPQQHPAATGE